MTPRNEVSGGTVDEVLLDAGHSDVPELRALLCSLASLAQLPVPAPGPELAAMLDGSRDELTRQRWLRKHRPAVIGLAVLAGMGLGASGVAATSPVPGTGTGLRSVQLLTTEWAPGWAIPLPPRPTALQRPAPVSPLFLQTTYVATTAADGAGHAGWQGAGTDGGLTRGAEPSGVPQGNAAAPKTPAVALGTAPGRVPGHVPGAGRPGGSGEVRGGPGKDSSGKSGPSEGNAHAAATRQAKDPSPAGEPAGAESRGGEPGGLTLKLPPPHAANGSTGSWLERLSR